MQEFRIYGILHVKAGGVYRIAPTGKKWMVTTLYSTQPLEGRLFSSEEEAANWVRAEIEAAS